MWRHQLLIALRNYNKQRYSFFINLIGLSTGLAGALLIFLWVQDELSFDGFHEKDDRLYQVMEHQDYGEKIMTTTSTPGLLSEGLAEEFPEFEHTVTTAWIDNNTLSVDEKNIKAEGWHVGSDYFQMFTFPFLHGDPVSALTDKGNIVISKSTAEKLFGQSGPEVIGKLVEYEHQESFLVSAVFDDIPENSRYVFDYALSFERFKDDNEWVFSWGNNGPSTFATVHPGTDIEELETKIAKYVHTKNDQSNVTLFLQKYKDRYLYGRFKDGLPDGGRIEYVRLFSVIALFILLIACINFMNLSTARAGKRAKEIGIKKAVGAKRTNILLQFLSESILICFLSAMVAVGIVILFLPTFNEITDKAIRLSWEANFIFSLLGITLLTGLLAGSYPAFYLTKFAPVQVFKGDIKGTLAELWARKGLVVFQFTMSIILIVSVFVVGKQISFVQNKNLGYNKDNIVMFEIEGKVESNLDPFLQELKAIPGVTNAASIGHTLLGRNNNTSGLNWEGKDPESRILFENVRVSHGLLETLQIEMAQGRSFSPEFNDSSSIIINETALEIMGFDNPIGQTITLWGQYDKQVVGVAKNFHFQSLHEPVNPLFFILSPHNTWNIMMGIEAGKEQQTIAAVGEFYQKYNPGFTFDFQFMDEDYNELYEAEQRVGKLSRYFAFIAIIISCLGLLGLAIFSTERRLKEIGIRKVLGSNTFGIIRLITGDFTKMVFLAIVIALPISFLLVRNWLDRFTYRIDLEIWMFVLSAGIALSIALFTVGTQALQAANINPVKCLRDE